MLPVDLSHKYTSVCVPGKLPQSILCLAFEVYQGTLNPQQVGHHQLKLQRLTCISDRLNLFMTVGELDYGLPKIELA